MGSKSRKKTGKSTKTKTEEPTDIQSTEEPSPGPIGSKATDSPVENEHGLLDPWWQEVLESEKGEIFCRQLVEEWVNHVLKECLKRWLRRQIVLFTRQWLYCNITDFFQWQHLEPDPGEGSDFLANCTWRPDPEPMASPLDAWAPSAVHCTIKPLQRSSFHLKGAGEPECVDGGLAESVTLIPLLSDPELVNQLSEFLCHERSGSPVSVRSLGSDREASVCETRTYSSVKKVDEVKATWIVEKKERSLAPRASFTICSVDPSARFIVSTQTYAGISESYPQPKDFLKSKSMSCLSGELGSANLTSGMEQYAHAMPDPDRQNNQALIPLLSEYTLRGNFITEDNKQGVFPCLQYSHSSNASTSTFLTLPAGNNELCRKPGGCCSGKNGCGTEQNSMRTSNQPSNSDRSSINPTNNYSSFSRTMSRSPNLNQFAAEVRRTDRPSSIHRAITANSPSDIMSSVSMQSSSFQRRKPINIDLLQSDSSKAMNELRNLSMTHAPLKEERQRPARPNDTRSFPPITDQSSFSKADSSFVVLEDSKIIKHKSKKPQETNDKLLAQRTPPPHPSKVDVEFEMLATLPNISKATYDKVASGASRFNAIQANQRPSLGSRLLSQQISTTKPAEPSSIYRWPSSLHRPDQKLTKGGHLTPTSSSLCKREPPTKKDPATGTSSSLYHREQAIRKENIARSPSSYRGGTAAIPNPTALAHPREAKPSPSAYVYNRNKK